MVEAGDEFEDFNRRWLVEHGALVKKHAKAMGFVRYVQSHKQHSDAVTAFAEGRGWNPPDGLTDVWWESTAAMDTALGSVDGQKASAALEADEVQFCGAGRISAFLAVEETIFDYNSAN